MFLIVILLSAILIDPSQAAYPTQKCLICQGNDCNSAKAQACPDDLNQPNSGKDFVDKAFSQTNATGVVATNFAAFLANSGFTSNPPTWDQLTRYVFLDLLFLMSLSKTKTSFRRSATPRKAKHGAVW